MDIVAEGKRWGRMFMLADGSMYAVEYTIDSYNPKMKDVVAINRSFAGHLLREVKKQRTTEYHATLARNGDQMHRKKILEHRLKDISKLMNKAAFNEREEHYKEIRMIEARQKEFDQTLQYKKIRVDDINRYILKFKETKQKKP